MKKLPDKDVEAWVVVEWLNSKATWGQLVNLFLKAVLLFGLLGIFLGIIIGILLERFV